MPHFLKTNNKLSIIKEDKIDKERDIQSLVENNLGEIFGYEIVTSEFQIDNLRIDTLAYNPETNAFVIIEYKRDQSFSVIDQGYAYLSILLNNKADFILEYFTKTGKHLAKNDIDWSQSKVVFLANSFTQHQQTAINFNDLPIELWEFKLYANSTITFNQLKSSKNAESINIISTNTQAKNIAREIKTYTINDLIKNDWTNSMSLYEKLSEQILQLDSRIEENITKSYVGYKVGRMVFCSINPYKSKLVIHLCRTQPKDLQDPENKVSYIKNSLKRYSQHLSQITVTSEDEIFYTNSMIKQVFKKTFSA
ncbi:hypothetical protein KKG65_03805 [Patescibacteria group bacterium]|nr:hypothetical protein [Patescibacteria group bacterium]